MEIIWLLQNSIQPTVILWCKNFFHLFFFTIFVLCFPLQTRKLYNGFLFCARIFCYFNNFPSTAMGKSQRCTAAISSPVKSRNINTVPIRKKKYFILQLCIRSTKIAMKPFYRRLLSVSHI